MRISRGNLWIGLLATLVACAVHQKTIGAPEAKSPETNAAKKYDPIKYDLVIYGATPGGVACAVRAAREGLNVQLVSHTKHVGGMLTNGLSTMDTLYNGERAPIYDELRGRIYAFYREKYGPESLAYQATQPGHPKTRYEAHVVERLISELLAAEPRISLVTGYYPVAAKREASLLRSVTFQQLDGNQEWTVSANVFADCSYEADLAAVAKVPYRVGRESGDEFNERHAGVIYMRRATWPPLNADDEDFVLSRRLNLYRYNEGYEMIEGASTGASHPAVQGYNMRTVITNNPANRVEIKKPQNYDPESYRKFGYGKPQRPGLSMPNQKFGLNEPKLVGEQDPYVEGDWATRLAVIQEHKQATLGLLYFRQHDPAVPASIRKQWQEYGLPRDEFADNGHMPYEIYARETRRIQGRAVFTENDAQLAPKLRRTPVHADSISITEWFLDSHACTPRQVDGSELEGMVMLKNQTFPGQVSYRTILPEGIDNLLVPVCLSSSHVGWGTIRLEPTWMSIGESAGHAVVLAKRQGVHPAQVDDNALVRHLAEQHVMISFFNDVEGHANANWYPAVQYLGAKGYFATYDARPAELLTTTLADAWIERLRHQVQGHKENPTIAAQKVLADKQMPGLPITARDFVERLAKVVADTKLGPNWVLKRLSDLEISPDKSINRGDACRLIFAVEAI
ncbi:FAD dependent oxidoreductase [Symmachiella macrocystis]|uniref:FAD dependent oxidoreductase n=1 Tax=Symmachiella macrocystis TaxID=2527985 RepID=A0A5C6AYS6_9PLAN|nr:FAD-dependent oxidoreductase [Symmachiella macrocystis]TWU05133.1 FAD dependent oxidoreductase [Symmachiella macrocystis]